MTESIYDKALNVFKYANDNNTTTHLAAIKLAKDRIEKNKKNSN